MTKIRMRALVTVSAILGAWSAAPAVAQTTPSAPIAFAAWDVPDDPLDRDIFVLDPNASPAVAVNLTGDHPDDPPDENPSWSPDGSRIAFDSFRATNQPTIHVMNADGSGITQISSTPCCDRDFQPAWSPDGSRIAFVSTRDGDGEYELYVMGAEGELVGPPAVRLTNDPEPPFGQGINDSQPTWSPDSSRIAFLANGRGADADSCDLFVVDAVDADGDGFGDNLDRVTFDDSDNCDPFDDVNPAWSPNSDLIAFDSVRNGDKDVWVVNAADPTDIRNVTDNPGYDGQPSWSPAGDEILFVSSRSGADELWSAPVPPPASPRTAGDSKAGRALRATQVTDSSGIDESQPDWAGDPTLPRPDVLIRADGDSAWTGDGVYTANADFQVRTARVRPGDRARFRIKAENDAAVTDSLTLSGPGGSPGFRVRYFAAGAEATDEVMSGAYSTGPLALGEAAALIVKVRARDGAAPDAVQAIRVRAISASDGSRRDAVKARVVVRVP